jgi:hypothetical protein
MTGFKTFWNKPRCPGFRNQLERQLLTSLSERGHCAMKSSDVLPIVEALQYTPVNSRQQHPQPKVLL